jgi:hypothetical protein
MKQPSPLKDAIDKVVAKMTGIMSRKEIVEAVLKHYPSKAKDPASSIMTDLRWRKEIVALGNGQYARTEYVLDGARFRLKVSEEDLALGKLQPDGFHPFEQVLPSLASRFVSKDGEEIPVVKKPLDVSRLTDEQLHALVVSLGEAVLRDPLRLLGLPLFGAPANEQVEEEIDEAELLTRAKALLQDKLAQEVERHDFTEFFHTHKVSAGDALLVTMQPAEQTYLFAHEPAAQANTALIAARDEELRQFIHHAIKRNQREDARDVIFRAYGNFTWLKEYPGSHWLEVVEQDDELRLISFSPTHLEIASIDFRMMFDMLGVDEVTEQKLKKRRSSIEVEIDDFLDKLDEAFDAATAILTEEFDEGGEENVITKDHPSDDGDERIKHNDRLIAQFFQAEKKRGNQAAAREKASDVALLADYLSGYEGLTLEYASLDELDEFLFDWYPRKVMNSTAAHAKQLAGSVRDFYRFLVTANVIRSARFAEAMYKLRDLAGEKVALYDRLPQDKAGLLFARLFGGW